MNDAEFNRLRAKMCDDDERLRREAWELNAPVRAAAARLTEHLDRRPEMQRPSLGRTVIITLTDAQLVHNNGARECTAIVVRVWNDNGINVRCVLDGPGELWLTSVAMGDGPGQWHWPVFVPPHVKSDVDAKF